VAAAFLSLPRLKQKLSSSRLQTKGQSLARGNWSMLLLYSLPHDITRC
jgi:hypothetical protein